MSKAVLDIETDGLQASKIHLLCIKNVENGEVFTYTSPPDPKELSWITEVIGHNIISFDLQVLKALWNLDFFKVKVTDTLVLSRMLWYEIKGGHSLEAWGIRMGYEKINFNDWSKLSQEMIEYCIRDVELTLKLYNLLINKLSQYDSAIQTEMDMARLCYDMGVVGFPFDANKVARIKDEIQKELSTLDRLVSKCFPAKARFVSTITPKVGKMGSLIKRNLLWYDGSLEHFSPDSTFTRIEWEEFNPSSPKQVCERLWEAGWKPIDKTDGHLNAKTKEAKEKYRVYGWKVNENNLSTLPESAPEGAKALVRRMLLETRVRKIDEWLKAYNPKTQRIHGTFHALGTWTHRMSHTNPNMANIAAAKSIKYNSPELNKEATYLGGLFRRMWRAPKGKALVGCDAEGIQLRVLAHYMDDKQFTFAVTRGNKKDGTDPHTLNQRALGPVCRSRDQAKAFIYAFLLGAGHGKVAQILDCSLSDARQSVQNFVEAYPGLKRIKDTLVPSYARQGWFPGFDNRPVVCDSEHLTLAGMLQNGERVVMGRAAVRCEQEILKAGLSDRVQLINIVHDEMIFLVDDDKELCQYVKKLAEDSITIQGEELKLKCPMKGDGHIGYDWLNIH